MSAHKERGNARDHADSELVGTRETAEAGRAHGVYTATLVCVPDAERAAYVNMLDRLLLSVRVPYLRAAIVDALRRGADAALLEDVGFALQLFLSRAQRGMLDWLRSVQYEVRWAERYDNVVTTVGKNEMLDKYFAGSSYTAALNMFLKGTGTAAAADTMGSHAGWLEVGLANAPAYSGNRPAPAFSSASAGAKAITSAQNFTFTSGGTVAGSCFVQGGSATKDNTTGTLVSAGDFTGGSKVVANTDQLNVSWSISV